MIQSLRARAVLETSACGRNWFFSAAKEMEEGDKKVWPWDMVIKRRVSQLAIL